MNNVKEYTLLTSDSSTDLNEKVNKFLNDGWELYGDPGIAMGAGTNTRIYHSYIQAMVRR